MQRGSLASPGCPVIHGFMRRLLVIVLLFASHGLALWWGSRSPRQGLRDVPDSSVEARVQAKSELGHILTAYRAEKAAADRKKQEDERTLDARIEEARSRIRPEDDLVKLVREAINKGGIPNAEVIAAFGVWFERDPAAALKEAQDGMRTGHWYFRGEITRHFKREGLANLQRYLDLSPKANRFLLMTAWESVWEQGKVDSALEAAAGLTRQKDRLEFLSYGWNAEQLSGHLREAIGLFDKAGAVAFLGGISITQETDVAALQEEAREAGFPPEALAALERKLKPSERAAQDNAGRERLELVKETPELFAETIAKEQEKQNAISFLQTRDTFRGDGWKIVAPDLEEWQTEVARGTLDPSGLYEKLMETVPGSEKISQPLLSTAALASFNVDPVKTMEWLKQTRPDWMELAEAIFQSNSSSSETAHPGEVYAAIFGGYQELSEPLLDRLGSNFLYRGLEDPVSYDAIFRQLPDGALKRKLASKRKERGQ